MRREYRDKHIEAVIQLYMQDYSAQEIRDILGIKVSVRQIQRWLNEAKIIRTRIDAIKLAHKRGRVIHQKREPGMRRIGISRKLRMQVLMQDNFRCRLCGADAKITILEVDHVDNNKNNNVRDNLQTLCQECNFGKARIYYEQTH